MPDRVLPTLLVLLEERKVRLDKTINLTESQPLVFAALYGHGDEGHVAVGRLGIARAARVPGRGGRAIARCAAGAAARRAGLAVAAVARGHAVGRPRAFAAVADYGRLARVGVAARRRGRQGRLGLALRCARHLQDRPETGFLFVYPRSGQNVGGNVVKFWV